MISDRHFDVIIVGGGAAGFFTANSIAEKHPSLNILIAEGSDKVLSKVLISGGGRCNVTHACFNPKELIEFYPRGKEFLLKPFKKFNCKNTVEWFADKGVELKTEADGRMFPVTDKSLTIANCLMRTADDYHVQIETKCRIVKIEITENCFSVYSDKNRFTCSKLVVASGGNKQIWNLLSQLGLKMISPVPSLFTFEIRSELISELAGISFPETVLSYKNTQVSGPLLITHRGLSGPAVLKLSAFGARDFAEVNYQFELKINWTGLPKDQVNRELLSYAEQHPKSYVLKNPLFGLPKRFWEKVCLTAGLNENRNWAETGKKNRQILVDLLCASRLPVHGKSTFKEEFVTAGGVDLSEINSDTFECLRYPHLYVVGEALNIDAVTGGFNFQSAWTSGYLAGKTIAGSF
ncbi:MAG: aminoacetone oxidase family FAD-binding enzyme [Bacteroidetes bacterium]|nr:aminoacetone oxidase family FAD-binding enzyme [Bacteroidota bacterium]